MNAYLYFTVYDLRLTKPLITILPPTLIVFQERNKIFYLFITIIQIKIFDFRVNLQNIVFDISRWILSFKSMFAKLFDCTTTKDFLHPILLFGKNSPKEPRLVHFKHIARVLEPPKNESFISCLLRSGLLP